MNYKDIPSSPGIYKLISPSGKAYIGQSINIRTRMATHKYAIKKSLQKPAHPKLINAMKKYGFDSFTIEILLLCSVEELNENEIRLITEYDTLKNGYNCTEGGEGGFTRSEEQKEHLRKINTGAYFGSDNIPFVIDGESFFSIGQASTALNIAPKTIWNRLNSSNPKYATYLYKGEGHKKIKIPIYGGPRECSVNGVIYLSLTEASKATGICVTTIGRRAAYTTLKWDAYFFTQPLETKDVGDECN